MIKRLDPNVLLLFLGTVFFALLLVSVDYLFKGEGEVFQAIASLFSGFGGALLAMIKANSNHDAHQPIPPPAPPIPPAGGPNA